MKKLAKNTVLCMQPVPQTIVSCRDKDGRNNALVESGYKIKAYSRAKAAGLWQFIPATGKRYGLYQDFWIDMRRNPELSTIAAMRYLRRLYEEFGDWLMAMAAYNCGEGCVRRRIREVKEDSLWDSTQTVTYWDLKLPKETMHYVPRILAAMTIGHYPEHYGMNVEKRELPPFDTVTVVEFMPLDDVAKAAGVDTKTIQELNLELNRWCTPPKEIGYVVRIPEGTRDSFLVAYEKMDKKSWSRWQYHKVKSGENLGKISRQYRFSYREDQKKTHKQKEAPEAAPSYCCPGSSIRYRGLLQLPYSGAQVQQPALFLGSAGEHTSAGGASLRGDVAAGYDDRS